MRDQCEAQEDSQMIISPSVATCASACPSILLALCAGRRLLVSVELLLRQRHVLAMERERRETLVEVVRTLNAGGVAVHFDNGAPLWVLQTAATTTPWSAPAGLESAA
jgi:hypothetical protein